jgi:hypothetical protein
MNAFGRICLGAAVAAILAQACAGSSTRHHAEVASRGDHVMGFEHARTTHRFRLTPSGGAIEVFADLPEDDESRDAIRGHLSHIAQMFSRGDFEAPMLIHDRVAPGVPTMKRKRESIRWSYEEMPAGGRIRIDTQDPEALTAVHEFLRFQIADHGTGDSPAVQTEPEPR